MTATLQPMKNSLALALCLAWLTTGCYTTERMPMRSPDEIAQFHPAVLAAVEQIRAIGEINDGEALAKLNRINLDGCPEDFAAALQGMANNLAARDESETFNSALRVKLIAKSYGVTFR